MWLIAGTIPETDFPLTFTQCAWSPASLSLAGRSVRINRGTPALLAAACIAAEVLGMPMPHALAAGDNGSGNGSRAVYAALESFLKERAGGPPEQESQGVLSSITFHYLMPDLDWHNRLLIALEDLTPRPLLMADAGYMYAAKMSGYAAEYDLFTPDTGELAFLADEKAPHPFYTRGFLLADEDRAEELITLAHAHGDAARHMLVKGKIDRVVRDGRIIHTVAEPDLPALEPIGGTGDTATGLAAALASSGMDMERAALLALRANRRMGLLAGPTPAWSIADLLGCLGQALRDTLSSDRLSPDMRM